MNIYFDNIINNTIIPNGISSKSYQEFIYNNKKFYGSYATLTVPEFVNILKNNLNVKKVDNESNGVYPLSICQSSCLTKQYCRYLVRVCISETAKCKIKKGDLKLIIHIEEEPCAEFGFNNLIDELLKNNISIFKVYSKFISAKYEELLSVRSSIDECWEFFRGINFNLNGKNFKKKDDGVISDKVNFNKHGNARAALLAYHGTNYDYRAAVVYSLIKKNLDNQCIITYNSDKQPVPNFTTHTPLIQKILLQEDLHKTVKKTYNLINLDDIKHVKFMLINEAYLDNNYVNYPFVTEKTTKCFHLKKPFLIMGQKHSLKELRKKGYKTFHPYIDESYDEIADHDARFFEVIKQFEKLLLLSDDDLKHFLNNVKEITEYNYNNFRDIIYELINTYTDNEILF